jgi:glycosyltransferase involved in cell wall biosynthesis
VVRGDGQGRVNYELTRHLLSVGASVTLFADRVDADLLEAGATWVRVNPGFDGIDLIKVWRFRRMSTRALRRVPPFDRIIACGVVVDSAHDLNVAHFVHGTWLRSPYHASKVLGGFRGWYQRIFSGLNARWEVKVFRLANIVGAVSTMVADELAEIGVDPEKVVILGNGVDVDEFHPGVEDRTRLGLPDVPALALFVGDVQSPIKNLDSVLRAMVAVPEMHLAIAGRLNGSPYPALAVSLGIKDRVHFLGFRRDIAALMRGADFFVLVSRRDSCPLVVLEAIASGLPVVTAKTVGNSNLIDGCCGIVLSAPDDLDDLTNALATLSMDQELREKYSISAREKALTLSWHRTSDKYVSVLGSMPRAVDRVAGE